MICFCSLPKADSTVSAAVIGVPVARDSPVSTTASAAAAKSLIVAASCVPVWFARASSVASVLLAVAPVATPFSFALSAADIDPAAPVVAGSMLITGVELPVAT
ncbi:hypothetical protein D9M73_73400 [compost metagenome]